MTLAQFDFELPRERIALRPAAPRDAARLLVVGDGLADHVVRDLPDLLRPGDLLVANDTRVIPARLRGRRGPVPIEVTLMRPLPDGAWRGLARPARRLRPGDLVVFDIGLTARVIDKDGGEIVLAFDAGGDAVLAAVERQGDMPLPPYIEAIRPADERDRTDYQTVFARRSGAVAAPTAGLHVTEALLRRLGDRGIGWRFVTLHVGAGTFLPIKVDDVAAHTMQPEWGEIGETVAAAVNAARAKGGRIVAVGSTSLRLLESAADESGCVQTFSGETALYITPGYRFKAVDMLLTNFHLPRSTLFVLVAAFAGLERMHAAYRHAIAAGYRFYSYGDACLLKKSGS
ncbi:MAG: tRNA preQ1(34) S-adenosylmethionine ribosyltransferase-isomerase QueA [Alphaproteobacteria bacterium]|nr:tRNA preQ1(34) S-adenosylmethionine ribosyltransferase-isomerase QueA [Alphaproteobacteria bacterium]